MGYYSEYINKSLSFHYLTQERKRWLKEITKVRQRDILVYASDTKKFNTPVSILPEDLLPFRDQLSFIQSDAIDVILETPGGVAESVEDMVNSLRAKFNKVGIIIPGSAKSAGTIFTMAGDEILMSQDSALGPIDAQIIMSNGKRFSADAFLDGLNKIKEELAKSKNLNPAYIPMLQNISPGEIQHCENAQNFAKTLVTKWLKTYKFKYWEYRSSGEKVTDDYKEKRAQEIASKLCKHADWLTHGRSIRISDLEQMKLQITDYSKDGKLAEAIDRYYTLLRITFDMTGIYKLFETCSSQIYFSVGQAATPQALPASNNVKEFKSIITDFECPKCHVIHKIQMNFENVPVEKNAILFPKNDIFICPNCSMQTDLKSIRLNVEAQIKKKIIHN
jgi:hypothetical protein